MSKDTNGIDLSALPPQMRLLIERIGFAATLKLLKKRGGRQVWVPKTATGDRVLAQVVGHEALAVLVKHHGGERLELPKDDKIFIQLRDRAMYSRRLEGATYSELVEEFGISRRWAIEVCQRLRAVAREARRQGQLFDACANGDS